MPGRVLPALFVVVLSACASSPTPEPKLASEALLVLEVSRMAPDTASAELARWIGWRCAVELKAGGSVTATLSAVDSQTLTLDFSGEPTTMPLADIAVVTRESEALHQSK